MSKNNLFYVFFFVILILSLSMSDWKDTRFAPRVSSLLTACSGVEIPKSLETKKIYQYCECVKNPVDQRLKEEKLEACLTEIYQDKERIRSIVFKQ